MRLGGPDPAQWCLSWAVLVWEGVLKTVVEDVEKKGGLVKAAQERKMVKREMCVQGDRHVYEQ